MGAAYYAERWSSSKLRLVRGPSGRSRQPTGKGDGMIVMLQAAGAVPTSAKDLILNAGLETKIVLGILVVLSLVSWAIMFAAGHELSKSLRLSMGFARDVER